MNSATSCEPSIEEINTDTLDLLMMGNFRGLRLWDSIHTCIYPDPGNPHILYDYETVPFLELGLPQSSNLGTTCSLGDAPPRNISSDSNNQYWGPRHY